MSSARLLTTLLLLLVAASASAGSYTLKWGDTLSVVASRLSVPVEALVAANGIADPDRVREGQKLEVPDRASAQVAVARPAAAVAPAGPATHSVRLGESLSGIAKRYGTTVGEIRRLNSIRNPNSIVEGTTLRLPASAGGPPPIVPVCPVKGADKFDFSNSFGDPRHGGRRHQGNDIFARRGTPVVASVGGTMEPVRGSLTGIGYEIHGDDGATYYGAHMDTMVASPGRVEQGQQVGTVGSTGNAHGTPPHLHFEVKPAGGGAVDPYPLLRSWCR